MHFKRESMRHTIPCIQWSKVLITFLTASCLVLCALNPLLPVQEALASGPSQATPFSPSLTNTPKIPSARSTINDIYFMTEQYPPFNYRDEGRLKGISIDILNGMLKEMNATISSNNVRHLPWARAYKTVLQTPGTCLFVMTRTPDREHLFRWVGPIMPTTIAIMAPKSAHLIIRQLADLKKYTIAALPDDIGHTLLVKNGQPLAKLTTNPYAEGIIEMMLKKRVDAWAYEESVASFFIRKCGHDPHEFESVFVLTQAELYFAFNIETPDHIISTFQRAFDTIKAHGDVDEIIHRYIP